MRWLKRILQSNKEESYARSLIEASLDPLVTVNAQGKITDVNHAMEQVTGVSRENLVGTEVAIYFTEPDKARAGYQGTFEKGAITDYPLTIRHKDGRLTDVLYNATVYRDARGVVQGVFAAARDITEAKRANLLDNILQSATRYAIVGIDLDRRVLSWNEGARRNYGYSAGEVIGRESSMLHAPEDIASGAVERLMATAYATGVAEGEFERVRKDGTRFLASVVITRRNDPSGRPIGYLLMSSDISEQKQAEEKLRYASYYARSLIETSLDPLVTVSPEMKFTDLNHAMEEAIGLPRDRLIGTEAADYFTEPEQVRAGIRQVFAQGFVRDYPLVIRHTSGKLIPVLYNASIYRNEKGEMAGLVAVARDVTERKKLETGLAQAAAYARSLIETTLDPFVVVDTEMKFTDLNHAMEEATGLPRDRLIGTEAAQYFTEPEQVRVGIRQVMTQGFVRDYPLVIRHTSGRVLPVLYNASIYRNEQGEVAGLVAAARDVTERKKLETGLAQAAAYARSLIETSLDPLVVVDTDMKFTDMNEAMEQATGIPRERLIGTEAAIYFTEPEQVRAGIRQVFTQGFVRDYPLTIRHTSGKLIPVLYNASVYRNEKGEVAGLFAAARDVTELKKLEKGLAQAATYARNLIEASLDPFVVVSPEAKITDVNEAMEQVTGLARERLIGTDLADYFTEPEKARQGARKVLAQGFLRDFPLSISHTSGRVTDVVYNASLYRNEKGEVAGLFAAGRDVTERKKLEQALQDRSLRLEQVLQEAREAVNVLSTSASEILTVISQLAAGATEAAAAVSETTTTVEEVRQTAQLANEKSRDIAGAAQNAAQVLQSGQKNVEAAVTEMNRIRDQMGAIARTIVTLSEQSQAIGEITGSVNELAEQSNLLAVNAAIEAAKAGEQGKGFGVVAQEIRSLAEQSKQATTQVRALLAEVQKAISNAVMATEQTDKVVDSGVAQSRQAGESIGVAVDATVEVARTSSQIVATSQQQLTGVDQVAVAMENINQTSVQNAQSTKQVETVARNLHELSQKLKSLVAQYQG